MTKVKKQTKSNSGSNSIWHMKADVYAGIAIIVIMSVLMLMM